MPKGLSMSFKKQSPAALSYVFKINGDSETYGVQTLAPDRQSFSDVYWHPGKKDEAMTEVYVKQ